METAEYVYKDFLDDSANSVFNKILASISEEKISVKGFYRKWSVMEMEEMMSWDIPALSDGNF